MPDARVESVSRSTIHGFHKAPEPSIRLIAGFGVEGDAHLGRTVQHRSRVAVDPSQPNLRQVHLIASELLSELADAGFDAYPGGLGENVTTRGLDLITLPRGTKLQLGPEALVEITGLRNPCKQIEDWQRGLLAAVLDHDAEGRLIRKAGIMGVVLEGGEVATGDAITVTLPPQPWAALERV
jgi:MOSC domain-containing protein YiiM